MDNRAREGEIIEFEPPPRPINNFDENNKKDEDAECKTCLAGAFQVLVSLIKIGLQVGNMVSGWNVLYTLRNMKESKVYSRMAFSVAWGVFSFFGTIIGFSLMSVAVLDILAVNKKKSGKRFIEYEYQLLGMFFFEDIPQQIILAILLFRHGMIKAECVTDMTMGGFVVSVLFQDLSDLGKALLYISILLFQFGSETPSEPCKCVCYKCPKLSGPCCPKSLSEILKLKTSITLGGLIAIFLCFSIFGLTSATLAHKVCRRALPMTNITGT